MVKKTAEVSYNSHAMTQLTLTQATPLIQEADGTVRITGSRVTLDTIIGAFQKGATAEQDSFPSLSLTQIYGAIADYLDHEADVEIYLGERRAEAEAIKYEIESRLQVPSLNYVIVQETALRSSGDSALLAWAAEHQRVVVTYDVNTIPKYAYDRIRIGEPVAGVVIVPEDLAIGIAIEELAMLIECTEMEELANQVKYISI